MVLDIGEGQEAWEEFLARLLPIRQDLGVTMSEPPTTTPIVDLVMSDGALEPGFRTGWAQGAVTVTAFQCGRPGATSTAARRPRSPIL
jgi:hypothetical protein